MRILNATNEVVRPKYDGAVYTWRPNEVKEITNPYAGRDILKRWGKHGLVDVTFSEKVAEKFVDDQIYIHEQRKNGVRAYISTILRQIVGDEVYIQDCGTKQSPDRFEIERGLKARRVQLEKYNKLLEQLEAVDEGSILKAKAEALQKQAKDLIDQGKALNKQADDYKKLEVKDANDVGGHSK